MEKRGSKTRTGSVPRAAAALLTALIAPSLVAGLPREMVRDFPDDLTYCPAHLGWRVIDGNPTAPVDASTTRLNGQLVFRAESPRAVVTFVACDNRNFHGVGGEPGIARQIDVLLDDVAVVRKDVYLRHQVINPYLDLTVPGSPSVADGCYEYNEIPDKRVGSVFDYAAVTAGGAALPFLDRFDAMRPEWTLGNATVEPDPRPGSPENQSLVLARRIRSSTPGDPNEDLCSMASVQVTKLRPSADYVIDFYWRVTGEFDRGDPVLSVFIDSAHRHP